MHCAFRVTLRDDSDEIAGEATADMRFGAISVWVAGPEQAERAAERIRELGHAVSVVDSQE